MARCPHCGEDNPDRFRFCGSCGHALARTCSNCGAEVPAGFRFCGECGTPIEAGAAAAGVAETAALREAPASERRLVSVLFADLVGFTSLSESRDAEEVRDLLSRYFDSCRRLISLYGGTVEKFIGDAVMAVWGTPVAQEDDAERAVRTALDLVAAVAALGQEVGAPELAARAGVLTGEAAVTLNAEGQGMVAGDLVNTASRIQAVAQPGQVYVGETTRRSTEAAIAYEDAGTFELKGKAEPLPLWRAVRVVAARGGALKSFGLEAPFVGRDRELRLVKELFHDAAEEGKAHLVSVTGIGGIGKSRLSWEFFKYLDGLSNTAFWHRGRCLSYGEGVTYWALAEMVKMRARIAEEEDLASSLAKLREMLEDLVPDPEERRWVEPRLAHLLGLEDRVAASREDLFGAWRLFFERASDRFPVVMVFEDLQWADAALLDFIEHLLEWSRDHPLFIMALARPELSERHPQWGAGRRNFTSIHLEPLSRQAMEQLLGGLIPDLPDDAQEIILARAEGVPLYAVETVRMLLDRGLLAPAEGGYRLTGPLGALDVPETLHALIAARLDGLEPDERRLLQDASVLGKTFTGPGLAAITGMPEGEVEPLLTSLVRKEILSVQADFRSPERGQYGFLQDLVKRVAYETVAKKDRRARHLAVAAYLETNWAADEDEIVEVIASHYVDAYLAVPDAPDAQGIRTKAKDTLARAGRRAQSLAAYEEAQRYYERAAELEDAPVPRAELTELAGTAARLGTRNDDAEARFTEAIALFEAEGHTHAAARVSARLAEILWWERGQTDRALEMLEASFAVLAGEEPDEDLAVLAAQLARFHFFNGNLERSVERVEFALEMAEALWLPETLSQALNTKALVLSARGRLEESLALLQHALSLALDADAVTTALRAYINLSHNSQEMDRHELSRRYQESGIALARKFGMRWFEWWLLGHLATTLENEGSWDESLEVGGQVPDAREVPEAKIGFATAAWSGVMIHAHRGELEAAERTANAAFDIVVPGDVQATAMGAVVRAIVRQAQGRQEEALEAAREALAAHPSIGLQHGATREAFVVAGSAAIALGDAAQVEELISWLSRSPPGRVPPYMKAHLARFRGLAAAAFDPDAEVEQHLQSAAGAFREIRMPFWVAVTQLELGEWLAGQGRNDEAEPLLAEARATFERLRARPWLERADRAIPVAASG
ncbi:MAG: AAA family ATPase [Actinomycetota bacterium]|nr:AAA family ATPase [Actinomycetota bacterium]